MRSFPFSKQPNSMDCGPTCLLMIAKYFGKTYKLQTLRDYCEYGKDGVSMLGICDAAEKIGLKTNGVKISFRQLRKQLNLPCILYWKQNHFIVIPPQKFRKNQITIADPAKEIYCLSLKEFEQHWCQTIEDGEKLGIALEFKLTPEFHQQVGEKIERIGWASVYSHLWNYKKYLFQLFIGVFVASLLQLILPFLTQSIVDNGINQHNLQFIYIVLAAQLMLYIGRTTVEFIRNRILLYLSTNINLSILSDFWAKMMKLPISFFDSKRSGDILQRINDQKRIEQFLTGSTLNTLFALFNLLVFSAVLLLYDWHIFVIFSFGSILYFIWIRFFLKFRRKLDYSKFGIASQENTITMQLINGMQEIKLNNAEHIKKWEWETIQASLLNLSFKTLSLNQYQQSGAFFINEGKNIVITFLVAKSVLDGQLTLGAMLAIQYIIGQLNSPIEQLVGFSQQAQDAKISIERLNEIHELEDEEPISKQSLRTLPQSNSITIKNLSFTYTGAGNQPVLKNINMFIPEGKITAIVGMSGSGKTTLIKLLLKFYMHYEGEINICETNLRYFSSKFWRRKCGGVMQDGYIFSDTIANNISVGDEIPDYQALIHAAKVANILSYIESLPLGFNTLIGSEGKGISQGQRQRILIARAVYKKPDYLFFDEATNSLDANNERLIMEKLVDFFCGRTVVVVAHRLSTVRNADNIVVLHHGEIVESGNHDELSTQKGHYYQLVKNQLELGS